MAKKVAKPMQAVKQKKFTEDHEFYQIPLYYDIIFGGDVTEEIQFYERVFNEYAGVKVQRVLEPACGPGLYMENLAKAGFTVTGYDLAPPMVKFTQERINREGLQDKVTVVEGDMRSITFPEKFDAAINQINSLGYLTKEEDIISHFKVTADSLNEGGVYIVELTIKCNDFELEHKENETWTEERDGVTCTATWRPDHYDMEKKIRYVKFSMHVDDNGKSYDVAETHELRLWTQEDIERLAKAGGLELVAIIDGNFNVVPEGTCVTGDTYDYPYFILRKPNTTG
jgi:ubiquinone/menaquinone biosynthesis C-methylase UbiE